MDWRKDAKSKFILSTYLYILGWKTCAATLPAGWMMRTVYWADRQGADIV
jgi:hypothetical protein